MVKRRVVFEVWNNRWNRYATDNEIEKFVETIQLGNGFISKVIITTNNNDIEIKEVEVIEDGRQTAT